MNHRIREIPQNRRLAIRICACFGAFMLIRAAFAGGTPSCAHPAPVDGHFDVRAPNLIVQLKPDFEPYAAAKALSQKYHFPVPAIWGHAIGSFPIRIIDPALIPLLQCEPSIESLSFDELITTGSVK
jgi:hypothetical protein